VIDQQGAPVQMGGAHHSRGTGADDKSIEIHMPPVPDRAGVVKQA